ncbi:MAG: hypothetical protein ABSH20_00360 [Tepidisphaeraceae bacterium]|jgi:hypothetical protein
MVANAARPQGAGLIMVLICAVALVFLVLVGTIYYYSWLHRPDPKGLLVVEGCSDYDGAHVLVTALASEPFEGVLKAADNYTIRLGLDAGTYSLRVWRGDETFYERSAFDLKEHQVVKLTLKPAGTQTRPASH